MKVSHHCNALRQSDIGKTVQLRGWVDRRRDHGGVIFIDLRDREGKTQIVFSPDFRSDIHKQAESLRSEWVLWIEGEVKARPDGMINPKMPTGSVDVYVHTLRVLNKSLTPPIAVNDQHEDIPEGEEVRLKYRYLDLRRPRQNRYIRLKSNFLFAWREALHHQGFCDIETPILMKSTPEGARDFLVPSRMSEGQFYALPQSPQTYKQLLMVAGFERYYQMAKCFRDEDLRADRQPEFMQIDCEMSFVEPEDIYETFESAISKVVKSVWNLDISVPFRQMDYKEAMESYGSDKPDLRLEWKMKDVTSIAGNCDFKVFQQTVQAGGVVKGLAAKGCIDFTRKNIDDLTEYVGRYGSKGLVWMRVKEDGVETQVAKFFTPEQLQALCTACGGEPGDLLFFVAGPEKTALDAMGHLRLEAARVKGISLKDRPHEFLWVTNFPLFEYSESEKRYVSMHHPFTSPLNEDFDQLIQGDKGKVRAKAYDLVLNGVEIGGGSIRIHDADTQEIVFKALGLSDEDVKKKFGYFVEAFRYGAPPHGGIAFGVDRFLATLENLSSIREFIPFPKTSSGTALMEEAPSEVSPEQLQELHIKIGKTK